MMYQLILVAIVCFIYSYSWKFENLNNWDDHVYIVDNTHLAFSFSNIFFYIKQYYFKMYIPLTMYSYMLDYSIWGLNSFGYHLQNIFWHIVTVLAVYNCFRLFNIKSWITLLLCIIFAVHPQRVESVVWLSERKDLLCAAFYFLSIYFYIRNKNKRFSIIAYLFFILSILSKPMAVSLPIILFLYEFYKRNKDRRETRDIRQETEDKKCDPLSVALEPITHHSSFNIQHYLKLWPYFLLLAIFIPVSIITQGDNPIICLPVTFFEKLYVVFFNVYWYVKETLFSTELNPAYPIITLLYSVVEVTVFYISLIILAIVMICRNRNLFVNKVLPLILCFIISLLPVIGLIRLGKTDHADRYSYIPSVFIWFAVGIILTKLIYCNFSTINQSTSKFCCFLLCNKQFIFIVLVLYSSVLVYKNIQYQKKWENISTLFYYSINKKQYNNLVLISLIDIEFCRNNYHQSIRLNKILRSKPGYDLIAEYNTAMIKNKLARKPSIEYLIEIEPKFSRKLQFETIRDRYVVILSYIITYYDFHSNISKASEYISKMLALPKLSDFMNVTCLGLRAFYIKDFTLSIYWFKKALEIQPQDKFVLDKLKQSRRQYNIKSEK